MAKHQWLDAGSTGQIISNAYSADGKILWKLYSGGALSIGSTTDRWTYDAFGRIKSVPGMVASQTYEADGQTKSITYANGVTSEFFYSEGRRWVNRIVTKNAAGENLLVNEYTRDALGRITSVNGITDADDWTLPALRMASRVLH